jgi:hypothetical protein
MHDLDRTQQYLEAGTHDFEFESDHEAEYDGEFEPEFESEFEAGDDREFEEGSSEGSFDQEFEGEMEGESLQDAEVDLAAELLEVTNDQELDQFLGKLFRRARRAFKKIAKSGLDKGLLRGIRGIAKAALPTLGGALGTAIPIPGVGTALGSMAGNAAAGALEFEGMSGEDREFEIARRVVRVGLDTAANLAAIPEGEATQDELIGNLLNAGRTLLPGVVGSVVSAGNLGQKVVQRVGQRVGRSVVRAGERLPAEAARMFGNLQLGNVGSGCKGMSGRWVRRGNTIVLLGVT